jgi:hypothetical protein
MAAQDTSSPFKDHKELYVTIDTSTLGDVPWECLVTRFPEDTDKSVLSWMQETYEVWYCNPDTVISTMLDNPDFKGQFDLCPYIDLNADGTC